MDTREITQAIKEARPKLSVISPLVAKIVLGFGVINVLLGIGLATTKAQLASPLVIAPNTGAFQLWGALFFVLGVLMLWGYWRNNWKFLRHTFVIGILFKFMWAVALLLRYISGEYSNPTLLMVWLFFAYIQAVTYIHFMPIPQIQKGAEDADK